MFSDPLNLTINAVTVAFSRTGGDLRQGLYTTSDGLRTFSLSSSQTKNRFRDVIRLDSRKLETDPLVLNLNRPTAMSAFLVIDRPKDGFYSVPANASLEAGGVVGFSSGASITRILAGEH
jgi:hypothetical protein